MTVDSGRTPSKIEPPRNEKNIFSTNFKGKRKNFKNNNKREKGKCFNRGKFGHYQAKYCEKKNNNISSFRSSKRYNLYGIKISFG